MFKVLELRAMSVKSVRTPISNSFHLDSDQVHHFVGPDRGINYLQILSPDNTSGHQQIKS